MGTSFNCPILFSAHSQTGQIIMGVGPFEMGNLAEMLEYLATQEFRDGAIESAARALTPDNTFTPSPYPQPGEPPQPQPQSDRTPPPGVVIHLRGASRTACGLDLWITGPDGKPAATVGSVPQGYIEHVTCQDCRSALAAQIADPATKAALDYINRYYRLSAKLGGRLRFHPPNYPARDGTIVGARDQYLICRLEGGEEVLLHPTWEVTYL